MMKVISFIIFIFKTIIKYIVFRVDFTDRLKKNITYKEKNTFNIISNIKLLKWNYFKNSNNYIYTCVFFI